MAPLLIHHYFNHGLQISVLGPRFANGPQLGMKPEQSRIPSDWIVAHASWTENMPNKRIKLRAMGELDTDCADRLLSLADACRASKVWRRLLAHEQVRCSVPLCSCVHSLPFGSAIRVPESSASGQADQVSDSITWERAGGNSDATSATMLRPLLLAESRAARGRALHERGF